MAQNVTIAGAAFSAVPAIEVPKTGGGIATFSDPSVTTATASDVAQGKLFLDSSGILTTGTASGGGGASNLVTGTFTGTTVGTVLSISVPYTGSGYPLAVTIFPSEGSYNSNGTFYKTKQQYAVCTLTAVKATLSTSPTYPSSGTGQPNTANVFALYKSSSSNASTLGRGGSNGTTVYHKVAPSQSASSSVISWYGNNDLRVFIANTSYGFMKDIEYTYIVLYSS